MSGSFVSGSFVGISNGGHILNLTSVGFFLGSIEFIMFVLGINILLF